MSEHLAPPSLAVAPASSSPSSKRAREEDAPLAKRLVQDAGPKPSFPAKPDLSLANQPTFGTSTGFASLAAKAAPSWLDPAAPALSSTSAVPDKSLASASWLTAGSGADSGWLSHSSAAKGGFEAHVAKQSVFGASKDSNSDSAASGDEQEQGEGADGEEDAGLGEESTFGANSDAKDSSALQAHLPPSGEEGETHVFSTRAKLYRLIKEEPKNRWKEIGSGPLRLNIPQDPEAEAAKFPRVVMRREGVLKLLLNAYLQPGVAIEPQADRMLQISCTSFTDDPDTSGLGTFLIKLSREEERDNLLKHAKQLMRLAAATGPSSSPAKPASLSAAAKPSPDAKQA